MTTIGYLVPRGRFGLLLVMLVTAKQNRGLCMAAAVTWLVVRES